MSRAQAFGICMLPAGPRKCDLPSLAANARPSFDHQMISDFQISPNKEAGKGKVDSLSFCSSTPTKKLLFMSLPSIWNSIGTFSTFFCITNYCIDGQGGCWMIGVGLVLGWMIGDAAANHRGSRVSAVSGGAVHIHLSLSAHHRQHKDTRLGMGGRCHPGQADNSNVQRFQQPPGRQNPLTFCSHIVKRVLALGFFSETIEVFQLITNYRVSQKKCLIVIFL